MKRVIPTAIALVLFAGIATSDPAPTERPRALHALNRLGFGARPGDVDRVTRLGVDAWIDQQLHPERIPDRAVEGRLSGLTTLKMSEEEIVRTFYLPIVEMRQERNRIAAAQGKPIKNADAADEL